MRILSIVAGTLAFLFIILTTIRLSGLNETYVPYDTAYFQGTFPVGVVGWEQNFLLEKNPQLILWVDAYRNHRNEIVVKPWAERNQPKVDLELPSSPTRPLLKELLEKFPHTRFVVNCNDNVLNIDTDLAQIISETKAEERVLVASDYDTILISLKQLKPRVAYGSSASDITRLRSFESLWVLPAAPLKADVYFVPLKYRGIDAVDTAIAQEIHRRQKKLFIGPLSTKDEVEQAQRLGADGLFVTDPFLLPQH
jgi:hypothetical protein